MELKEKGKICVYSARRGWSKGRKVVYKYFSVPDFPQGEDVLSSKYVLFAVSSCIRVTQKTEHVLLNRTSAYMIISTFNSDTYLHTILPILNSLYNILHLKQTLFSSTMSYGILHSQIVFRVFITLSFETRRCAHMCITKFNFVTTL